MATINPYQTYQQNSVMTASSEELTLMLYNGCLKFIKLAKKAMLDKQFEEKNKNLLKAQAIIQELRSTLNPDIALSKELEQLYEYQNNSLMEANMKNDAAALEAVLADVTELRNTWKQAMALAKQ
ncbi:flagellar export chaperone FliS [Planococcus sp. CP5-4]|uniref:flagellar export chaperone FliS n=1 Tax=unclassified Planococcus (in: firmicutes) TaxID=2662419 RepID=UPI001C21F838|nr:MULTISPECIES: flagellar export chaperone FliS [unclassified Planococcus (in: firmicutes)]MBU9672616.1 flagellar export chaperone FliS [Planococcus sp. CP5-4_YE]MBV0909666.1 flagellar export chaperone FliS [Planococcus sp. CP5-4_UN]MBW6064396.1 flagellar export chaperone FliS [Planococcus sp. CP5-4]